MTELAQPEASPSLPPALATRRVEIRSRLDGRVLYATDVAHKDPVPIRTALARAYLSGADLSGANLSRANLSRAYLSGANLSGADLSGANLSRAYLSGANLSGADLSGANLSRAYLSGANLSGANLSRADLSGANLSGANLSGANLSRADLSGANLSGAYLSGANLSGADLSGANLSGAYLSGADLSPIRDDIRLVLDVAPLEVAALLAKLRAGEVDGTVYQGPCACLLGTIANVRGCDYQNLVDLRPDSARPAERFFLGIAKGATPETNPVAAIVDDWICEWQAERGEGDWLRDATEVAS